MKIVINPEYEYLRKWIEQMPSFFEDSGELLFKGRNLIKVFTLDDDMDINVKRYRKPSLFNRIVYSFFRKSKAARSYYNTIKIAEKGFDVAAPISYIEIKRSGLLSDSYYICRQCQDVKEIREYNSGPLSGNEDIIEEFARYSAALHDAGIYHLDYSPGNIIFRNDNGKYSFILVDVNRMKFMPVSFDKGCRNFARLFICDDIYRHIGIVYSESRKNISGKEKTIDLLISYKNSFWKKKARLKRIKRFLGLKK